VLAGLIALVAAAGAAAAHTGGTTGYASIAVEGSTVRYSLTLWPDAVPAVTEALRQARAGDVASRDRLLGVIRDKVALTAQDRRCQPGPGLLPAPDPAAESITLVVEFACAEVVRDLLIRDDLFDVLGSDHHTLARIETPAGTTPFAFGTEARETRVRLDAPAGGLASFVWLGIEHILTGWDHLLFLLALLLPGGGALALLKIVTAFTLAHSITLGLAVLDVVALPDRLVEAVIALSIAAVAAENLYLRPAATRRWIASFGFGLVHGFGFSSALREIGLPTEGLLLSLLGFNAGVEAGQILALALALPAMVVLQRTGWKQRMVWGSSVAILAVGLALFVERALL
jgi:hypothetical protein